MAKTYKEFVESYRLYWRLYGGWRSFVYSPYFHAAIFITAICAPVWLGCDGAKIWSDAAVSILPNLMGFSVAGMAVFLAFSHPETMRAVTEDGAAESYFITTVTAFFHFILVQTIALVLGFVGKHYANDVLSAVGTLFLTYAVFGGLAMAMQILNTARIINAASSLPPDKKR